MNLSVEHVLMFALVICALYYLMGDCGVEGRDTYKRQNKIQLVYKRMEKCLCENTFVSFPNPQV